MIRYIIILLAFTSFSCSKNKSLAEKESSLTEKIDTTSFSYKGFNHGVELALLSNGNFIHNDYVFSCLGGGEIKRVFGKYKMDSTRLTLFSENVELTIVEMMGESRKVKGQYGVDSLKIKTSFNVVNWGKRKYLLSDFYDDGKGVNKENDYIRFAYYLNAGWEPEDHGYYLVSTIPGLEDVKTDFDLKQIPEEWRSYFLESPISAKVTKVTKIVDPQDEEDVSWIVEINKGMQNNVRKGLRFQAKSGGFSFDVDSVNENTSYGKTYFYDADDMKALKESELRTKWD